MKTENNWPVGYIAPHAFFCSTADKFLMFFETAADDDRWGRVFIRDKAHWKYRELGITPEDASHDSVVVSRDSAHAAILIRYSTAVDQDDTYEVVVLNLIHESVVARIQAGILGENYPENSEAVGFTRLLSVGAHSFDGILGIETSNYDKTSFETRYEIVRVNFDDKHLRTLAELGVWEF